MQAPSGAVIEVQAPARRDRVHTVTTCRIATICIASQTVVTRLENDAARPRHARVGRARVPVCAGAAIAVRALAGRASIDGARVSVVAVSRYVAARGIARGNEQALMLDRITTIGRTSVFVIAVAVCAAAVRVAAALGRADVCLAVGDFADVRRRAVAIRTAGTFGRGMRALTGGCVTGIQRATLPVIALRRAGAAIRDGPVHAAKHLVATVRRTNVIVITVGCRATEALDARRPQAAGFAAGARIAVVAGPAALGLVDAAAEHVAHVKRARVIIVACRVVSHVLAACRRIARVQGARLIVLAIQCNANAFAHRADIAAGASAAIAARFPGWCRR